MLQTTIKSEKDFNCQWHKYTENKGKAYCVLFFPDICYFLKLYIHFYKPFFYLPLVDNKVFNIFYDQLCF